MQIAARFRCSGPSQGESTYWQISAYLDPGIVNGIVRQANDTLEIDGAALLPDQVIDGRVRLYQVELDMDPTEIHQRVFEIVPPVVEGFHADSFNLVGIGRPGPDTVQWTPGTDLRLSVLLPSFGLDLPSPKWLWSLTLSQPEAPQVQFAGAGLPPAELVIPAIYVARTDTTGFASLHSRLAGSIPSPFGTRPDTYYLVYDVSSCLLWWVEIASP